MSFSASTETSKINSAVTFTLPSALLRLEALTVFLGAVIAFIHLGGSGLLFVLLILAPDLSAVGYTVNPRIGSMIYDVVHTYAAPALLILVALLTGSVIALQIALIWTAHIGADRLLGFGLKYPTAFKDTHLQRV